MIPGERKFPLRSRTLLRPNFKRILVLRAGAIGDTVLCFPVLQALRKTAPEAELVFVGRSEARFLALASGLADEVLDLGSVRFMPLFARSLSGEQARAAASFLRSFDLTVSLIGDPDGSFRELLLSRGAGKLLSLRSIPPDEWVPRGLFRVIESVAAIPFRGELPFIRPGRPPPLDVRDPFVVFHVGSGSKEKNWPPERFASLVEAAEGAGYRVFLPEGEADRESVRKVLSLTGEKAEVVNLALTDLAALLAQASFFVGNDSGITHIAGQVGVHTVAVFGPTDPARWKPLGPRVRAVGGRDGSFPSLEEVIDSGGLGQFLENR